MTLLTAHKTQMLLDREAIVTPVTVIKAFDTTPIAENIGVYTRQPAESVK